MVRGWFGQLRHARQISSVSICEKIHVGNDELTSRRVAVCVRGALLYGVTIEEPHMPLTMRQAAKFASSSSNSGRGANVPFQAMQVASARGRGACHAQVKRTPPAAAVPPAPSSCLKSRSMACHFCRRQPMTVFKVRSRCREATSAILQSRKCSKKCLAADCGHIEPCVFGQSHALLSSMLFAPVKYERKVNTGFTYHHECGPTVNH